MVDFFRRALKKLDKLDIEKHRELLYSAINKISLLETVSDSINVGILVCDKSNNLLLVNNCARRMLPIDYNEVVYPVGSIKIWSVINDDDLVECFRSILINKDKTVDREIDIVHNGRNKLLSINVVPLVQKKMINGSLIYIEDITDKRKEELRLRRAENLASLTTLAAGMAHDIKNPLGSISIHIQLLQKTIEKQTAADKNTERYFHVVKEEIERLNRIVVDFLFAVRPMNLELRKGDINKLIGQLMEFVLVEFEQSKILCLLELDDNVPEILMDERFMKQALLNLVTNAKAAMPSGGVLTIATNCTDNEIKISVCDTGIGIKKENLEKIFEPYYTTKETGTGLGLTQVFKIIKEHQGEITVDSAPGTGSDFRIILPMPQNDTRLISYNKNSISSENEAVKGVKN